jgi:hypothetical protein
MATIECFMRRSTLTPWSDGNEPWGTMTCTYPHSVTRAPAHPPAHPRATRPTHLATHQKPKGNLWTRARNKHAHTHAHNHTDHKNHSNKQSNEHANKQANSNQQYDNNNKQ